jgi:hypothetical protein
VTHGGRTKYPDVRELWLGKARTEWRSWLAQQRQMHYVNWDDTYSQYEQGLIGAEPFSRLRSAIVYQLRVNPGFRSLYVDFVRDNSSDSKFHKFIEEVVAEATVSAAT